MGIRQSMAATSGDTERSEWQRTVIKQVAVVARPGIYFVAKGQPYHNDICVWVSGVVAVVLPIKCDRLVFNHVPFCIGEVHCP